MNLRLSLSIVVLGACGSEQTPFQSIDVPHADDGGSSDIGASDTMPEDAGADALGPDVPEASVIADATRDAWADRGDASAAPVDVLRPVDAAETLDTEVATLEVRVVRNGYRFPMTMASMCTIRDGTVSYGARMCGDGLCTDFTGLLPMTSPPTVTVSRPTGGVFYGTNIMVMRGMVYGMPRRMNVHVTANADGPLDVLVLGCSVF